MTLTADTVLVILALVCFVAKFVGTNAGKLDLIAGGFAFLTATLLF